MVTGPALLLNLDNSDAGAIAAEAAVLPVAAVARRRVDSCQGASTALLLLLFTHLHRGTKKGHI